MADTKAPYTSPPRSGYSDAPRSGYSDAPRSGQGNGNAARNGYGPQPIGGLMAPLTRPVLRRLHPGAAQVMAEWEALVGPGLAARTTPRALDRGTLTIACAGPVALELTMLAPQVMARINSGLGRPVVQRLRFIQAAVPRRVPRPPSPPAAALPSNVSQNLETMPEGPLRDALARLAQGVYQNPT